MRRSASVSLLVALAAFVACRDTTTGERVTLHFWAMGAEGEHVQTLVREFERDHPGVDVRVQQVPFSAAHEKLLTAFVGNATPDVAQLGNTWVPEFQSVDALAPLDAFIARSDIVKSAGFFDGIWKTNVVDGAVYGIPWYVDTRVIFYRTDLLARAGYDSIPDTWAGWRKAMEAVQRAAGPRQWAIFLPTNEWMQPVLFGLQNGASLLRDGGRFGAFAQPAFRQAFDFYVGLFRDGLAPVAGNNDMANPYQELARGTFAMWITGPWNIGEFQRRLPAALQGSWATAALPGPTGAGASNAGGASLVVFRRSKHQAAAFQLVEFLSRPDVQLRFYQLTGDLPARQDAWNDDALIGNRHAKVFYEQLQRVASMPKVPEWEVITSKVIDHAEAAIRGGSPVDRALANLDDDVNRLLEKRRWLLARTEGAPAPVGAP
jgi:multiple sugar transport system substrate-binding protein